MFDLNTVTPLEQECATPHAKAFLYAAEKHLDFAFQPIVDIHNGNVFGYEALLRGYEKMSIPTIGGVFDRAFELGVLYRLDIMMRVRAIDKFVALPRTHKTKLFYNLDNRIITAPDYFPGTTKMLLKQYGLPPSTFCLEISERHEVSMKMAEENLARYRGEDYCTAIDDFGAGYSGLKLLQDYQPDFLKIDRSFITGIARDKKRKLLVSTIADLSSVLGMFVIAEGVETQEELRVCQEIGCDLVQGYLVERPQQDIEKISANYEHIISPQRRDASKNAIDARIIYEQIEYLPPLRVDDKLDIVFEAFRRNKHLTFFPVVDESGAPVGVVHEKDLKDYIYSPYGKALVANRGTGLNLRKFLSLAPIANINDNAERILEIFSMSESSVGVLLVKEFGYLGFLSAPSLLRVINEKNLAMARDASPLTKLPGNASIAAFVNDRTARFDEAATFIYLDLDNFKAFNDAYGFRQGDRAILLFADLMRKKFMQDGIFLGHVGGDDFFVGAIGGDVSDHMATLRRLLDKFRVDVESFYDAEAREKGFICGKDRHGEMREFPLMTASASVIHLAANRDIGTPHHAELDASIAHLKKLAKASPDHISVRYF